MRFADAIDEYVADMRREGRIASPNTDRAYRDCLERFCDHVDNRDPSKIGRADVKTFLRNWSHPNTQRQKHAILASFFKWTLEEGYATANPADMVRRARPRDVSVFRLTLEEVVALMDATAGDAAARRRERWVIHLGLLAGLRRQELQGLQGRHFARAGWVWVSTDIAKRGKERWVPVLPELAPVVAEIRAYPGLELAHFVVPTRENVSWEHADHAERPDVQISTSGLYRMVRRVGRRAGLGHDIGPHTLRHAFGDHVARYAGLRAAQALLGHSSVATTEESYTGRVSLDELAVSVQGFTYRRLSAGERAEIPHAGPDAR